MTTEKSLTQVRHGQYAVDVLDDVRIRTADPRITLSADVWLPRDAGRVPVLVTVTPYRKDASQDFIYGPKLRWFAERGYACVLVDLRGTGSSDGIQRPPFDPGEADDPARAIDWAVAQPWCDGNIGMWGLSYVARMALLAATRRPPALKAIMPMMTRKYPSRGLADAERMDFFLTNLMGAAFLSGQLLPPLADHTSAQAHRRWQQRLHETEPVLMDWARHGQPGDPVWIDRDQAVDHESITVPTFLVGGWLDLLGVEGVIESFESIPGSKKLLVGPWEHDLPTASGGVDFLRVALRWWDYWLRGVDNGIMDEPPITLYVQGERPGWRAFESWPPGKGELVLVTGADLTLTESALTEPSSVQVIAEYQPDPTIGALTGLSGVPVPAGGSGEPPDQHDDDIRGVSVTSTPFPDDLVLAGRPEVTVRLVQDEANPAQRVVATLAEVSPNGRSRFLTCGVVGPDEMSRTDRIVLGPIIHRVRAGHRLRVAISDSHFPRLTPLSNPSPLRIAGIELFAATMSDDEGVAVELPTVEQSASDASVSLWQPRWDINRDMINDAIEVVVGYRLGGVPTRRGHLFEMSCESYSRVARNRPDAATMGATYTHAVKMTTGEEIQSTATVRLTQAAVWARGKVTIDGIAVFSRIWEAPLAPGIGSQQ